MHTELHPQLQGQPAAERARDLIGACVHCGFCTATCPSYQVLGNELDSPRGRIYLVKQLLEGEAGAAQSAQQHLDTCLTCRACETTCPSGVQYGQIAEIGRHLADGQARPRPLKDRLVRRLLGAGLTSPLFGPALAVGQRLRPLLPKVLASKLPQGQAARSPALRVSEPSAGPAPARVLLLRGCVQPAMSPNIEAATQRVLARLGVRVDTIDGCCGALRAHLGQHEAGLADMRRLTTACHAHLQAPTDAATVVLSNASGCGVMVKDYGQQLGTAEATTVAQATRDLGEFLFDPAAGFIERLRPLLAGKTLPRIGYHPPCTLQHGQKLKGGVEAGLSALGFEVLLPAESHLCCGSAGTYSVLQPDTANALRTRKLGHLDALQPALIASSNIGCISHLGAESPRPVRHWIEILDAQLDDTLASSGPP